MSKWVIHLFNDISPSKYLPLKTIPNSELYLMRGSLTTNFKLNSIHQFLRCTFRLQQFFTVLISSDFAHIPNSKFPLHVVYNGENRLLHFFIFEKFGCKHWGLLKKKVLIWGSESVNMLIRGVVAAVRVFRNDFTFTPIIFLLYL